MAKSIPKESKVGPKESIKDMPDTAVETAASTPKKRSFLKIALLLAVLLGSAIGGAWYFFQNQQPAAGDKPSASKATKAIPSAPPLFVSLEPFTVNLQHDDTSPQYLQVGLSLKVTDTEMVNAVKLHLPEIRNRVLLLLSSKKASDISTLEGKQKLSIELLREINQPLSGALRAQGVDSVLFTSFVIQ